MKGIDYKHSINLHTLEGPRVLLPLILENTSAKSILDVGCGTGTWLKVALELGIEDIQGVDGVRIKHRDLLFSSEVFNVQDLTRPWQLGRKYDLALCLEVAEHLEERHAELLVASLTDHADTIAFSAACPGQQGQHHVNCQWPDYWQERFNNQGFVCSDELRWRIWNDQRIEPWYRQNLFIARRAEPGWAGKEPRLKPVVHPAIINGIISTKTAERTTFIKEGFMPFSWYLKLPFGVLSGRLKRLLGSGQAG